MILSLENISKIYNGKTVLDNISLTIENNDRIGLVGDNGCGKSTLLRIITGKEDYEYQPEPNTSSLVLTKSASVGYLEQNSGLDCSSTVIQEMTSVFSDLLETEKKMRELEQLMSQPSVHDDEKRFKEISAEYDRKTAEFEAGGGYMINVRIKTVLFGMGFKEDTYNRVISTLSGGEKTRLAMAKLLLESPDLLILDEPTNHLDFDTIMWLEGYLSDYKGALLIVSHDRYFLDKLCTSICHIERCRLRRWKGNYTRFTQLKEEDDIRRLKEYEAQQEEIAKLQEYIDKNLVRASTTNMAKSRMKKLESMELLEKPVISHKRAKIRFEYDITPPQEVLSAENMDISVGEGSGRKTLVSGFSLNVRRGEKVGIVGANGIGKSTLLKMLMSPMSAYRGRYVNEEVDSSGQYSKGKIRWAKNVKIAYFDQEGAELSPQKSCIDEIHDRHRTMSETQVRSILGQVMLTGENVFKPTGVISGGERAKLCFAIMMLERANVLIMDEPTNHLDMSAKEVIEEALSAFEGTIIFVSHDRYLLDKIADRIVEITPGKAEEFGGGFEGYMTQKRSRMEAEQERDAERRRQESLQSAKEKQVNTYRSKEQRAKAAKRRERIRELEGLIDECEVRIAGLQEDLCNDEVCADYELMKEKCDELEKLKALSGEYTDEWVELMESEA